MEVACDRHLGPTNRTTAQKEEGLAFQVTLRSRNVSTHGLLTTMKQMPAKAAAIQQVLLEAADKVQEILSETEPSLDSSNT